MQFYTKTAILFCLLCSCSLVPPTELHNSPSLPDSEVAIVTTEYDLWSFTSTTAYFTQVDDVLLVGTTNKQRVEVLPGSHTYKLNALESDIFNARISVTCSIEFDAEAGHEYHIGLDLWWKYYDGARHDGAHIWVEDKSSGEIIAGAGASESLSAPSSDGFCTPCDPVGLCPS